LYAICCSELGRVALYLHRLQRTHSLTGSCSSLVVVVVVLPSAWQGKEEATTPLDGGRGEVCPGLAGEDFCIIWTAAVILVRKQFTNLLIEPDPCA
jgi:hypothetical protein